MKIMTDTEKNNQYDTLSEAVKALRKRGYDQDFEFRPEAIECKDLDEVYAPKAFDIDEFHRFEGMSNPGDSSIIYAISTESGVKGILIDAYGAYSSPLKDVMIKKFQIDR